MEPSGGPDGHRPLWSIADVGLTWGATGHLERRNPLTETKSHLDTTTRPPTGHVTIIREAQPSHPKGVVTLNWSRLYLFLLFFSSVPFSLRAPVS